MLELQNSDSLMELCTWVVASEVGFLDCHRLYPDEFLAHYSYAAKLIDIKYTKHNSSDNDISFVSVETPNTTIKIPFSVNEDKTLVSVINQKIDRFLYLTGSHCYLKTEPKTTQLIVEFIVQSIGKLMNEHDNYFNALLILWRTLDNTDQEYSRLAAHKIHYLKTRFRLSEDRLKTLTSST